MMRLRLAPLAALIAALLPGAALACACCADPGARFRQDVEMGAWEASVIGALRPESPARLYLTACGMDCVRGIADPQRAYDVGFEGSETGLTLVLSDRRGLRGSLVFPWPDAYTWFGTDTALTGEGGGDLYTEMEMRGSVAGTGDFAHDGPMEAELVLSGHGNMCITRRSFHGWILTVSDDEAEFRLFGTLSGY